ncbi:MAG TPA: bacteriocin [Thermohalobaculum sp.]|nr:bacteriocin [Thermohalobaculum sp.]
MRKIHTALALGLGLTLLAACGNSPTDRAISGAGIGAATGATGSALAGGDPVTGALVGGAVGGAVGALTDSGDIYFGRPIWRR